MNFLTFSNLCSLSASPHSTAARAIKHLDLWHQPSFGVQPSAIKMAGIAPITLSIHHTFGWNDTKISNANAYSGFPNFLTAFDSVDTFILSNVTLSARGAMRFITSFPRLRRLWILSVFIRPNYWLTDEECRLKIPHPGLKSLNIRCRGGVLLGLIEKANCCTNSLQRVRLPIDSIESVTYASALFAGCAQSLQDVDIFVSDARWDGMSVNFTNLFYF